MSYCRGTWVLSVVAFDAGTVALGTVEQLGTLA